jgi:NADH dehydrogenase [ubiquinone] 1 alpha subcomplex assembly factor 7
LSIFHLPNRTILSNPLMGVLRDVIQAEGPITVEQYMQIVLHHPQHGYYSHGDPLGVDGDFGTSPEISQMFGEMIGVWCLEVWQQMGEPDPFILLELGPGRGTLLKDLFRATQKIQPFHKALRLHLLECNATLRLIQLAKLADHAPTYIADLAALPPLPVLAISNEFFDTFPLRQFMRTDSGWRERLVTMKSGKLVFMDGVEIEKPCKNPFSEREAIAPKGWTCETSPQSLSMVGQLAAHMAAHGGAGLIVDYGYASPSGKNTLFAVRDHKPFDILASPGEADVTAEVDFEAFRYAAESQGARVVGPTSQGDFLRAMGIELRAALLQHLAPEEHTENIHKDFLRLTCRTRAGTWFKVLGLMAKDMGGMPGFL